VERAARGVREPHRRASSVSEIEAESAGIKVVVG